MILIGKRCLRDHNHQPTCFDLFSGAGGFSLGMEAAGFRSVGFVEIDDVAAGSCIANLGVKPASFLGSRDGDIEKIRPSEIRIRLEKCGITDLDLLVASPPCQGFSRVGRAKLDSLSARPGSFAQDSRNGLYRRAISILKELQPKFFILENVTGVLHLRGRNVAEDICDALTSSGYNPRCAIVNAAWYGVPQTRERVVVLASREDLDITPTFPNIRRRVPLTRGHLSNVTLSPDTWRRPELFVSTRELGVVENLDPAVTVSDAFDDLPHFSDHLEAARTGSRYSARREDFEPAEYSRPPRNEYCHRMRNWDSSLRSQVVTDHYCRFTPRDFQTFGRMEPGDRYPEAVAIAEKLYAAAMNNHNGSHGPAPSSRDFIPPYSLKSFPEKWRKLDPALPSWTVTAHLSRDAYSHIHPDSTQARTISPREAARLQSFPDAFVFDGNTGDIFRQIGNAVPPLLAEALGKGILAQLIGAPNRGKG
ncbi:DNA cytosine methyltransferase [bacterium]|nr:DNA cytosine methyltransferase [bacterium]